MRPRRYLLAIPPESEHDNMKGLRMSRGSVSVYFRGLARRGGVDFFCGRCGRILAHNVGEHQFANVWVNCPKCSWLNGMDLDLGWAKYVVKELQERKLSIQRAEELLAELRGWQGSADEFIARNPDIAKSPISWLAKISLGTIIAFLALLVAIYSAHRSDEIAQGQLRVEQEQLHVDQRQAETALTPEDVQRLATELHRLQEEVRIKPPSRSTRGRRR